MVTINKKTNNFLQPSIPLLPLEVKKVKRVSKTKHKLLHDPTKPDSPTYELEVEHFQDGNEEEVLKFLVTMNRVLVGQNIATEGPMFATARALMQGRALAVFNEYALTIGSDSVEKFYRVLDAWTFNFFPRRALAIQRRYMRRFMRKNKDQSVREFVTRVVELNEYLPHFPSIDGKPNENPASQKLSDEEIMEILEFGVPNSWQRKMIEHGFDPSTHTKAEFIEFCERMEYAEQNDTKPAAKPTATPKAGKGSTWTPDSPAGDDKNKKSKGNGKYCRFHKVKGHDTGECKVVLAQVDRMSGAWEAAGPNIKNEKKQFKEFATKYKQQQEKDIHALFEVFMQNYEANKEKNAKKRKDAYVTNFEDLTVNEHNDEFEEEELESVVSQKSDDSE